jgi:hypothetical protein
MNSIFVSNLYASDMGNQKLWSLSLLVVPHKPQIHFPALSPVPAGGLAENETTNIQYCDANCYELQITVVAFPFRSVWPAGSGEMTAY